MKKRAYPVGRLFYQLAGFTKVIVLHLTVGLYGRIKGLAKKDERSLQVTARRILEKHFEDME
jgi:predicted DNA-binding protein